MQEYRHQRSMQMLYVGRLCGRIESAVDDDNMEDAIQIAREMMEWLEKMESEQQVEWDQDKSETED